MKDIVSRMRFSVTSSHFIQSIMSSIFERLLRFQSSGTYYTKTRCEIRKLATSVWLCSSRSPLFRIHFFANRTVLGFFVVPNFRKLYVRTTQFNYQTQWRRQEHNINQFRGIVFSLITETIVVPLTCLTTIVSLNWISSEIVADEVVVRIQFRRNILCRKRKIQFGCNKDVHKVPLYEFIAVSGMLRTLLPSSNVSNNKIIAEAKR